MKSAKSWYLYLIECADGSIYTGITVDVAGRYAAHRNGTGARYTRSHPPLRLLGWEIILEEFVLKEHERGLVRWE